MTLDFAIDEITHLRSICLADAPDLYALIDGNRPYLQRWVSFVDRTKSIEDVQKFIHSALDQAANGRGPCCCVTHANAIVGTCGLKPINKRSRSTELGYWLAESVQGRGIMTSCVRALIDYAFRDLQINRVELRVATGNEKSRRIARRLGFSDEGILREGLRLNDRYVDLVVCSILKQEWANKQVQATPAKAAGPDL